MARRNTRNANSAKTNNTPRLRRLPSSLHPVMKSINRKALLVVACCLCYGLLFAQPKKHEGMVWISGGTFEMGSKIPGGRADEYPVHKVTVKGFWMDATEVTNAQFAKFVEATGYVTTSEISGSPGS